MSGHAGRVSRCGEEEEQQEEQQEEQEQSQRGQSAGAVPVGWPAPRSGGERGAAVRTGVRAAMAELLSWGGALLVWDRELEGSCGGVL